VASDDSYHWQTATDREQGYISDVLFGHQPFTGKLPYNLAPLDRPTPV
jgi:hypothetical protein